MVDLAQFRYQPNRARNLNVSAKFEDDGFSFGTRRMFTADITQTDGKTNMIRLIQNSMPIENIHITRGL